MIFGDFGPFVLILAEGFEDWWGLELSVWSKLTELY